jgi:uncharacterized sulfatase
MAGNGQPCPRIVEFVDIYPTLTSLAKIASPDNLEGRDLSVLLKDPIAPWDGFAVTQILRPADSRLSTQVMGCSIRTQRWRYTEWAEGEAGVELYDHQSDPMEFDNLAKSLDSLAPDSLAKRTIKRLQPMLRSRASGAIPTVPVTPERL